jgi:nucleotide-binding universal stress UspA family protein
MKTVVGVDSGGSHAGAVQLLADLQFADNEVYLLHCSDSGISEAHLPEARPGSALAEDLAADREQGAEQLRQARLQLEGCATLVHEKSDYGRAASALIEYADHVGADLIAAGSVHRGAFNALISGSVARALAISAPQSVLIGKGSIREPGPVKAVLATDHSDYCNRAFDLLLKLRPAGLSEILVITATQDRAGLPLPFEEMKEFDYQPYGKAVQMLEERNAALLERLAPLAESRSAQVLEMPPTEAFDRAMAASGAQLLIMAAQGHGFFHRFTIGSLSLRQVVSEPHSVLILRV